MAAPSPSARCMIISRCQTSSHLVSPDRSPLTSRSAPAATAACSTLIRENPSEGEWGHRVGAGGRE
jgi:hypothetical protein